MKFFDLDADATLARIRAIGRSVTPPTMVSSLVRGAAGFTVLGVMGFLPWVLGWGRQLGEGGMYAACALVFVALSGPLLHRLIIGPGSLARFYRLFLVAFPAYAILWCALWFGVRFKGNDYVGLVVGCSAFAGVAALAFGAGRRVAAAACVLTALHVTGYWLGSLLYAQQANWVGAELLGNPLTKRNAAMIARAGWGLCYGLGFGAGLGAALHICQHEIRCRLAANSGTLTGNPG